MGCGPAEERVLLTGLHAVADIYCENCKTTLGWKYVSTEQSGAERAGKGVAESLTSEVGFLWPQGRSLTGQELSPESSSGTILSATLIPPSSPSPLSFPHTRP